MSEQGAMHRQDDAMFSQYSLSISEPETDSIDVVVQLLSPSEVAGKCAFESSKLQFEPVGLFACDVGNRLVDNDKPIDVHGREAESAKKNEACRTVVPGVSALSKLVQDIEVHDSSRLGDVKGVDENYQGNDILAKAFLSATLEEVEQPILDENPGEGEAPSLTLQFRYGYKAISSDEINVDTGTPYYESLSVAQFVYARIREELARNAMKAKSGILPLDIVKKADKPNNDSDVTSFCLPPDFMEARQEVSGAAVSGSEISSGACNAKRTCLEKDVRSREMQRFPFCRYCRSALRAVDKHRPDGKLALQCRRRSCLKFNGFTDDVSFLKKMKKSDFGWYLSNPIKYLYCMRKKFGDDDEKEKMAKQWMDGLTKDKVLMVRCPGQKKLCKLL